MDTFEVIPSKDMGLPMVDWNINNSNKLGLTADQAEAFGYMLIMAAFTARRMKED